MIKPLDMHAPQTCMILQTFEGTYAARIPKLDFLKILCVTEP